MTDDWSVTDTPIGLASPGTRTETDSIGAIEVPADRYWGAQTQRALVNFDIGDDSERLPIEVYRALGMVKGAAAIVNGRLGTLAPRMADLIERVAAEVVAGELDTEFPLRTWQTGSGTQTNMNVNEVISNRCIQLAGGAVGSKSPVHPNDHVNRSQSSNDVFPTAMHLAALGVMERHLVPGVATLRDSISAKAGDWADVVKIGRTHLQDATPLTVGQEWSGWAAMLDDALDALEGDARHLHRLAIGGTAVGTGLNAPASFGADVAAELAAQTGWPLVGAPNKFAALASSDPVARTSSGVRNVALAAFKIANDVRWLGSGPRTGLGELRLPANEPGSSIMPGKVNPTQAEALMMVCQQVIGNDVTVAMAAKDGSLQLNTCRPVMIANLVRSMRILGDACAGFATHLVDGTELNTARIADNVGRSAMLVTALSPEIGYDAAAAIAHRSVSEDVSLRDAAIAEGVDPELFDRVVVPIHMTRPG